jgi:hypothetical protein
MSFTSYQKGYFINIFSHLKRILQKLKDIRSALKVCIRCEYQFRLTARILWNILWARVNTSLQNGILTNSFPVTVCIRMFWLSTLKFSNFNRWHKNFWTKYLYSFDPLGIILDEKLWVNTRMVYSFRIWPQKLCTSFYLRVVRKSFKPLKISSDLGMGGVSDHWHKTYQCALSVVVGVNRCSVNWHRSSLEQFR